jgi:hypothetical protein
MTGALPLHDCTPLLRDCGTNLGQSCGTAASDFRKEFGKEFASIHVMRQAVPVGMMASAGLCSEMILLSCHYGVS